MIEWAIFVLLFIALVVQVITARRGPWEREKPSPPPYLHTYAGSDPFVDALVKHYGGEPVGYVGVENTPVGLLASGVDPLWGKNPPWS